MTSSELLFNFLHRRWRQTLALPDWRKMQLVIFWGVILVSTLLIGFSAHYSNKIRHSISEQVDLILSSQVRDNALVLPLIVINGRDLVLRGTAEPDLISEMEIERLAAIDGLRSFDNQLEVQPKPSAELRIELGTDQISLKGKLSGNDLDQVIAAIRSSFRGVPLRDRVVIDDRLGRPLWLDGLGHNLDTLQLLKGFSFYGWRDTILIDGVADTPQQIELIRYTLPAFLNTAVHTELQLYLEPLAGATRLSLLSGWNGAALSGDVAAAADAARLDNGFAKLQDIAQTATASNLNVNPILQQGYQLDALASLIPQFGKIHDLRLQSSGNDLVLWGRVDSSAQLGQVVAAVRQSGLADVIDNQVFVDPAKRGPELSIFRDRSRAVVTGRLPGERARKSLINAMRSALGVDQIEDLISIEPNVAYSPWLEKWSILFPIMPASVFGLTLSEKGVFVSGEVDNELDHNAIDRALASIFPDAQRVNWLTVKPDS